MNMIMDTSNMDTRFLEVLNDNKKTVIYQAGEKINSHHANQYIGDAIKNINSSLNLLLVYACINEYQIGIQLTHSLKVIPIQENKKEMAHAWTSANFIPPRYRYDVIYKNNQVLFSFNVFTYSPKGSSIHHQNDDGSPAYPSYKLRINAQGLNITTKYLNYFTDEDAQFLMKEFPYYLKVIKYVIIKFTESIASTLRISNNILYISNMDASFLDEPIDNADREMKHILHTIYAEYISRNFNK